MKLLAETCQIFGLENRKKIAKFSKITFTCRSLSYLFYAGCDIIRWYWQIGLNTWLYCFPISDGWIVSRGTDHSYIFLIGWLWSRDTTVFAGSCHSTDHSYTFWLVGSDHVILQFSLVRVTARITLTHFDWIALITWSYSFRLWLDESGHVT